MHKTLALPYILGLFYMQQRIIRLLAEFKTSSDLIAILFNDYKLEMVKWLKLQRWILTFNEKNYLTQKELEWLI